MGFLGSIASYFGGVKTPPDPAGSDKGFQYNDNGILGGTEYADYDKSTGITRMGDIAGGNYSELGSNYGMRIVGDRVNWNDINIAAYNLGLGAAAPTIVTLPGSGIKLYAFAGGTSGTNDELHGALELLHDWVEGTPIIFHVHWMNETDVSSANGGVTWAIEYVICRDGHKIASPVTSNDAVHVIPNPTEAFTNFITNILTITPDVPIGTQIAFRIFRNRTATNTYAGLAIPTSVGIHYAVNTLGSRGVSTK